MERSGQAVWESFCAGPDERAFEALYDSYRGLVWTICWRMLGNEDDARDAFQSAWARLFACAREQGARIAAEPVERLIYQLSLREADALKKRRLRRGRREIAMDELPEVGSGEIRADAIAAAAERRTKLETIVAMLPEKYRLPIQLHYLHGLTQVQIAAMMDLPRATVASRLARGLRKLTPLAERIGLGEVAGVLGAIAAGGALLAPPKALAASVVFAQVQTLIASGAITAGSAALTKSIFGMSVLHAKVALVSGALLITAVVGVHQLASSMRQPKPQTITVQEARPRAASHTSLSAPRPKPAAPAQPVIKVVSTPSIAETPTPTPTPTPIGPTCDVQVAVIWGDTQSAAEGTTVGMQTTVPWSNDFPISGRTDANGLITLKIPQAWTKARARAVNPDSSNEYQKFDPGKVDQPIVMKLNRAGRIYGTVMMTDGKPAAGAEVQSLGDHQLRKTISGADGSFELFQVPGGETKVSARLQDLRSDIKEKGGHPVTAIVGQKVGPVLIKLEPGLTVSGIVTASKSGQPVVGAEVKADEDSDFRKHTARTDATGRYTLYGLAGQQVMLSVKTGDYAIQGRYVTPTPGVEARCDFALEPGGEVEVTAIDTARAPIEGASIMVSQGMLTYNFEDAVKTDIGGHAVVRNLPLDRKLELTANKTGVGRCDQKIQFSPGEFKTSATLTLAPETMGKGYIAGTVTDADGKPLAGINIFYGYFGNPEDYTGKAKTDAAGQYVLEATNRNTSYQLAAYDQGWGTEIKESVPLGTKDQPTKVDFTLKPGHWVSCIVTDEKGNPLPGIKVAVRSNEPFGTLPPPNSDLKTDASGRFRAENLPAKIRLDLSGENIPDQIEKCDVDSDAAIVLKSRGVIRGKVIDKATNKPVESFVVKVMGGGILTNLRRAGLSFTSPEGKFEVSQLKKDDKYQVTVESKGYASHVESEVAATGSDDHQQMTISLDKAKTIRGVLIDADTQQPIANARIAYGKINVDAFAWQMVTDAEHYRYTPLIRKTTGADGRFELDAENDQQTLYILPPSHQRIILKSADREKYVRDGEYIIPLQKGAELTGRVFLNGKLQPRAQVTLNKKTSGVQWLDYGSVNSDENGVFKFSGLEAGEYHLAGPQRTIENGGFCYFVFNRKCEIKAAEKKELNLGDDLGSSLLAGAVINDGAPVAGAWIHLKPMFPSDYNEISGHTDANGVFAIDGLKPGKYNAHVNKPTNPGRDFRIHATIEVGERTTHHDFEKSSQTVERSK